MELTRSKLTKKKTLSECKYVLCNDKNTRKMLFNGYLDAFVVNFEKVWCVFLVFILLILNAKLLDKRKHTLKKYCFVSSYAMKNLQESIQIQLKEVVCRNNFSEHFRHSLENAWCEVLFHYSSWRIYFYENKIDCRQVLHMEFSEALTAESWMIAFVYYFVKMPPPKPLEHYTFTS